MKFLLPLWQKTDSNHDTTASVLLHAQLLTWTHLQLLLNTKQMESTEASRCKSAANRIFWSSIQASDVCWSSTGRSDSQTPSNTEDLVTTISRFTDDVDSGKNDGTDAVCFLTERQTALIIEDDTFLNSNLESRVHVSETTSSSHQMKVTGASSVLQVTTRWPVMMMFTLNCRTFPICGFWVLPWKHWDSVQISWVVPPLGFLMTLRSPRPADPCLPVAHSHRWANTERTASTWTDLTWNHLILASVSAEKQFSLQLRTMSQKCGPWWNWWDLLPSDRHGDHGGGGHEDCLSASLFRCFWLIYCQSDLKPDRNTTFVLAVC